MHTRLLAHDNLIDDVEVSIEGIKQKIKQLNDKSDLETTARKTDEMKLIGEF
jgi:hypothetical protein